MNWIDNALAVSERSLLLTGKRAEVLATNLANANTPGYKARDVDFRSIMSDQKAKLDGLSTTSTGHIGTGFAESLHSFERPSDDAMKDGGGVVGLDGAGFSAAIF